MCNKSNKPCILGKANNFVRMKHFEVGYNQYLAMYDYDDVQSGDNVM